MASSSRLTGKNRGEKERFAYIPESVMESAALQSAPPTAYKVLCALVVGRPRERNGTLCLSASHARKYGIRSHDTLTRILTELQTRGLIVVTREVPRFKKWPRLYAVTWWPIHYRNGEALEVPEKETRAFEEWSPIAKRPISENPRPDGREMSVPVVGMELPAHRPDFVTHKAAHRPDSRAQSKRFGCQ